jgi:uncharacterized pyridoxal phosphate-containing UPF0001 family protein
MNVDIHIVGTILMNNETILKLTENKGQQMAGKINEMKQHIYIHMIG